MATDPNLAKPYSIDHPLNAEKAQNIDEMFRELYDDNARLQAKITALTALVGANSAAISGQTLVSGVATEGEEGPTGPPGPQGERGLQGLLGALGLSGEDGEDGCDGGLNGGFGGLTHSWAPGPVVFGGPSGQLAQNGVFFWDDTNTKLGVGTATPATAIQAVRSSSSNSTANYPEVQSRNTLVTQGDGASTFNFADFSAVAGNGVVVCRFIAQYDTTLKGHTGTNTNHPFSLYTNGFANSRLTCDVLGNISIGTLVFPSTGTNTLVFGDGTAPATMGSNTAGIYAEDVGGTVRMFGIDEAGTTGALTQQSTTLTSGKYPIATTGGLLTNGPTPLAGTKVYYVSDTSGGAVTRKLTFTDGILTAET